MHPSQPLQGHHSAPHQPTAKEDPDDFGAFQASNSLPMQEGTAATGELPHALQPVQLQEPLLPPTVASTPPTAAVNAHPTAMKPHSVTGWAVSGPQISDTVEPLHSSLGVPAHVEAIPAPPMPNEVGQTSGDRYAAFRDLSMGLDTTALEAESTSMAEDREQFGVSHSSVDEHKEQAAQATGGVFAEVCYMNVHCHKVCVIPFQDNIFVGSYVYGLNSPAILGVVMVHRNNANLHLCSGN